jgi:hypothetical protein
MDKKRIRGQVVYKDSVNDFYPKFTILSEEPFLQDVFESWEALDAGTTAEEEIFEPLEQGLGTRTDIMYVKTERGTFIFVYWAEDITWGSEVVSFEDPVDFEGNIYTEGG